VAEPPAIERTEIIEGLDMSAEWLNGRGTALVTDLQARRAGGAGFSVSVRGHTAGSWTILEVEGEMDMSAFPLIPDLVGRDTSRIVLELRGVTFMDARGLGAMIEAQRRAREAGGWVRLVAPSRSVRRVLMLTACDRIFLTFDTVDQALSTPDDADPESAS
jgi:stage II sporulation protein AA (anti-sigma F factor antagonist)